MSHKSILNLAWIYIDNELFLNFILWNWLCDIYFVVIEKKGKEGKIIGYS